MTGRGRVSIVGAGPGDPELLTLKGRRLLESADAVVHDRLVAREIVDLARGAERHDVGKLPGAPATAQDEIDALLVRLAREGKRVVRLKGGDPFVFGRTASELDALVEAGIPFEIVPGVSAAIAVPAYAGIPVTDRRYASAVAFVTAVQAPESDPLDWSALARIPTLIVLMGAARLDSVAGDLVSHGADPARPAAAIEWGTTTRQRAVTSNLGDIARDVRAAGLGPPLLIVVGDVVALAERYRWFAP